MIISKKWAFDNTKALNWPGDLDFDTKWPSFKLDLDFIKASILRKFHKEWVKNCDL